MEAMTAPTPSRSRSSPVASGGCAGVSPSLGMVLQGSSRDGPGVSSGLGVSPSPGTVLQGSSGSGTTGATVSRPWPGGGSGSAPAQPSRVLAPSTAAGTVAEPSASLAGPDRAPGSGAFAGPLGSGPSAGGAEPSGPLADGSSSVDSWFGMP